jgi:hypothetical protein
MKFKEENLSNFFYNANYELENIIKDDELNEELFDEWKEKVILKLDNSYKIKMNRLNIFYSRCEFEDLLIDIYKLNSIKTILRDMYFKYNANRKKTKKNLEIEKLLKAREENIDFELEIAKMITGDNLKFPDRSSSNLTEFFYNLGYNFVHSSITKRDWVRDRLEELDITKIHFILSEGLFKKKYFIAFVEKYNFKNSYEEDELFIDDYINIAKKEFEKFIKNSISMNKSFDLSSVLNMNINIELLFDNKANTEDIKLNNLIEEAKDRFLSNDKQIALEKLWDAFERFKTYFLEIEKNMTDKKKQKEKKISSEKIVSIISENFDEEFINTEFKVLTVIGNTYSIRHHEVGKEELTSKHINYFFFRMLSLIDLCLSFQNKDRYY